MGAWLAVAVGGAMGSVARFWLAGAMTTLTGPRFPWGTLLINILGSFVIGLVAGLTLTPARVGMHPDIRNFLMTGICGGFTPFSACSRQPVEVLHTGCDAGLNITQLHVVLLCLIATWSGWLLGRL